MKTLIVKEYPSNKLQLSILNIKEEIPKSSCRGMKRHLKYRVARLLTNLAFESENTLLFVLKCKV